MNYLKLVFELEDHYHELLIADLMDMDFYGFEQEDGKLTAYIESRRFNDSNREQIELMLAAIPGASFLEQEEIEKRNWNEQWEQSIVAKKIGRFFVQPTWSSEPVPEGMIPLKIDPKMAFGTGYHETTRLMLRYISRADCTGKLVLDAGTGTGILAIAALLCGADKAAGFDFDPWSQVNALENAALNNVSGNIDIRLGGFEQLGKNERFDLTLANINRNVILEYMGELAGSVNEGGTLCLSGLLETDESEILNAAENHPLELLYRDSEGEWILLEFKKGK